MSDGQSLEAAFLGIIQGVTEFLPISSSAHLLITPWLLGWQSLGLTFDVVVHGGTLVASILYFKEYWKQFIYQFIKLIIGKSKHQFQFSWALLVGTIPAVVVGWLFEDVIRIYLRSPIVVVCTLCGFGLVLWWSDQHSSHERSLDSISWRDGLLVGLAQALALVPGVSRSGVTISAALLLGISRADAARFSFLLGTPILLVITSKSLYELGQSGVGVDLHVSSLVIGAIFSFISGYLCIRYFLKFLQVRTYQIFVVYRLVLAGFILLLLVVGRL